MTIYKIGLISDLHDVGGDQHTTLSTIDNTMSAVGVDAYWWLGDMVDSWVADDIAALCEMAEDNTYWVMGNHDGGRIGEELCPSAFVGIVANYQPCYTSCGDFYVDYGNWRLIGLNNGHDYLSDESYAWLDNLLVDSASKYIIIMTHMGICPNVGDDGAFVFASDATATKAMINSHVAQGKLVRACLFGHGHTSGYSYPTHSQDGSVTHFEITTSHDNSSNYAILTLYDNGELYIDGYGLQTSLNGATPNGRTYTTDSNAGDDTGTLPSVYPRKSMEGLFADIGNDLSAGDAIVFQTDVQWQSASYTEFPGTIHHHVVGDGLYSTTLVCDGKTLTGQTERLPQGDVFRITEVA